MRIKVEIEKKKERVELIDVKLEVSQLLYWSGVEESNA